MEPSEAHQLAGLAFCTVLWCLPTQRWWLNDLSFILMLGNDRFIGWLFATSQFDSYSSFTEFQLGLITFYFSHCIQDIIAFMFKDIPGAFLESYHLTTNDPHDSLSSMAVISFVSLMHQIQVVVSLRKTLFCLSHHLLLLYPNVLLLARASLGLGCG